MFVKNRPLSSPNQAVSLILAHDAPDVDDTPETKVSQVAEALRATPPETRDLINRLRTSIPAYAEEYECSNVGDTSLRPMVYSTNLIRVTSIIVSTPSASTSVELKLGRRTLFLPSGLVTLAPISFVLAPQDERQLIIAPAVANPAWYWLMGEQLPEVNF